MSYCYSCLKSVESKAPIGFAGFQSGTVDRWDETKIVRIKTVIIIAVCGCHKRVRRQTTENLNFYRQVLTPLLGKQWSLT